MCSDVCTAFKKDKCIGEVLKGCSILQPLLEVCYFQMWCLQHEVQNLFFFILKDIFPHPHRLISTDIHFQVVFCLFATCRLCSVSVQGWTPPLLPGNQPCALAKPTPSEHFPLHVRVFPSLCRS